MTFDIKDTPYEKIVNTLIVTLKLFQLLKDSTVIADSYVKDGEFYAEGHDGHVHWFSYQGKLARDMEPLL